MTNPDSNSKAVLQHVGSIVAVAGLLAYLQVGFAHSYFYGELGLTLSEVGLGYTTILANAVVSLTVTILVVAAYLLMLTVLTLFYVVLFAVMGGAIRKVVTYSRRALEAARRLIWRPVVGFVIGGVLAITLFIVGGFGLLVLAAFWVFLGAGVVSFIGEGVRELHLPHRPAGRAAVLHARPSMWAIVQVSASLQLALLLLIVVSIGIERAVNVADWVYVLTVVLGLLAIVVIISQPGLYKIGYGRTVGRLASRWRQPWLSLTTASLVYLSSGLVVAQTAATQVEHVRDGRITGGVLALLVRAPIDCVRASRDGTPVAIGGRDVAMLMGFSPTHAAFLVPRSGAVLAASGNLDLTSVDDNECAK